MSLNKLSDFYFLLQNYQLLFRPSHGFYLLIFFFFIEIKNVDPLQSFKSLSKKRETYKFNKFRRFESLIYLLSINQLNKVSTNFLLWNSQLLQEKLLNNNISYKRVQLVSSGQWSLDPLGYEHVSSLGNMFASQRVQWHWPLDTSSTSYKTYKTNKLQEKLLNNNVAYKTNK